MLNPESESDSGGFASRLKLAGMLLGFYAVLHLAVAGALYALHAPDAGVAAATLGVLPCAGRAASPSDEKESAVFPMYADLPDERPAHAQAHAAR